MVNFRSAADMVAPLGAGQMKPVPAPLRPGLYNAVARGIRIKIVADKASSPPGYGGTKIWYARIMSTADATRRSRISRA